MSADAKTAEKCLDRLLDEVRKQTCLPAAHERAWILHGASIMAANLDLINVERRYALYDAARAHARSLMEQGK